MEMIDEILVVNKPGYGSQLKLIMRGNVEGNYVNYPARARCPHNMSTTSELASQFGG